YGSGVAKDGYLKLGSTIQTLSGSPSDNDLDRDANGIATVYDKRNDSTLLLAQVHVFLCKFHNRLLDDVIAGKIPSVSDGDPFEHTKRLVTWHYQWIIRNDLLPKLVMSDVLEDITLHWPRLYRPQTRRASIPVEFSLAAFQFGHAAVNFLYNINRNFISCPQEATMHLTGFGHFQWPAGTGAFFNHLPEKFVLDAGRLFGWAPRAKQNFAAIIGTLITEGLYKIPEAFSVLVNNEPANDTGLTILARKGVSMFSLPEATLLRGSAVGLPSGQQACQLAGIQQLGPDQLTYGDDLREFLYRNGMLHRTPLFYYLLREAEVAGRASPDRPPGTRLGPLGSRIVAEVILGILTADPDSYLYANWQPPDISIESGHLKIRIDSLKKLMFYAKDYKSPRQ
ncbi:MAG: peroxidase family protein, partial [Chthoniobacterales bacterium]